MSYAQRSPYCGCAHFTAPEESVKRASLLFGMCCGHSKMKAVSVGEVLGSIPRGNSPLLKETTKMLVLEDVISSVWGSG